MARPADPGPSRTRGCGAGTAGASTGCAGVQHAVGSVPDVRGGDPVGPVAASAPWADGDADARCGYGTVMPTPGMIVGAAR